MRTFVIGGGGFIGSHLVQSLQATGRNVSVIGRRLERPAHLGSDVEYIPCDVMDQGHLLASLNGCEELVDLSYAGIAAVESSNAREDHFKNINAMFSILDAAVQLPILRKLIVMSSGGTVYGAADVMPISESYPTCPISPYGITKLTLECYALMYHKVSKLPVSVVRPSNAFGVGQRPFTGQGFISTAIGLTLRGEPIPVFGSGGTIRDYVHVRDVARGIVAALDLGVAGQAYNIGSSVGRSNLDIIATLRKIACRRGVTVSLKEVAARVVDVPANVLSFQKLQVHTGWSPIEDFEGGVLEMWDELSRSAK